MLLLPQPDSCTLIEQASGTASTGDTGLGAVGAWDPLPRGAPGGYASLFLGDAQLLTGIFWVGRFGSPPGQSSGPPGTVPVCPPQGMLRSLPAQIHLPPGDHGTRGTGTGALGARPPAPLRGCSSLVSRLRGDVLSSLQGSSGPRSPGLSRGPG